MTTTEAPTTVTVHAAQPIRDEPAPAGRIVIATTLPPFDGGDWRDRTVALYAADAKAIVDVLLDTLPGGTVDQVLAELLLRKASLFRVPFGRADQ